MAEDVIMPQMGESIAEGTITAWLKKVGDKVERDEPLFEISTDKVDAEIPSPTSGVLLEIKAEAGETVEINSVVAVIGGEGEQPAASQDGKATAKANGHQAPEEAAAEPQAEVQEAKPAPKPAAPEAPAPQPAAEAGRGGNGAAVASEEERRRTRSSPLVRKIAAEHGIDITQLSGSGIGGRVTKDDIMAVVESGGQVAARAQRAPAPAAAPAAGGLAPTAFARGEVPEAYKGKVFEGDKIEPLSNMRAKISEHMVMSKNISAHVATVWDIDFSRVAALRAQHKALWKERHDVNLTYTGFIMKAAVDAIKDFAIVNASLADGQVIYHQHVNLGLAVALDWGLIVPVVQRADELNLLGLARRSVDLAERARNKKLKPDEVQHGTFTITNPGIYGPLFGLPVINQPQVAILGVGAVEKRPVVVNDALAIRTRAYLSLSFDHRLIDGAVADQFMAKIKHNIENFDESEL